MHDDSIIYAQVLLLDNKIEEWKICQDKKDSPLEFKAYWKRDKIDDYTMDTKVFNECEVEVPKGWTFNSYVYNVLGIRFINQYEYVEDYRGSKAKETSLEEQAEFLKSFQKAFGDRFQIVGQLGSN